MRKAQASPYVELRRLEPTMDADINIAEMPYESGAVRFRYSRVLSPNGTRWLRHGLFVECHENGTAIAEGTYVHGQEHGQWREFHENGQLAAEGSYSTGREEGLWRFWNSSGGEEGVPGRIPQWRRTRPNYVGRH